jgi:hypothetical protein
VFIDRTSAAGLTHSAHCSSLGRVAPTGSVSKRAGRPGADVVVGDGDAGDGADVLGGDGDAGDGADVVGGDGDAGDGADAATLVVTTADELGVRVVPPPLEHAPSAAAPSRATTTPDLQRPPGMA